MVWFIGCLHLNEEETRLKLPKGIGLWWNRNRYLVRADAIGGLIGAVSGSISCGLYTALTGPAGAGVAFLAGGISGAVAGAVTGSLAIAYFPGETYVLSAEEDEGIKSDLGGKTITFEDNLLIPVELAEKRAQ